MQPTFIPFYYLIVGINKRRLVKSSEKKMSNIIKLIKNSPNSINTDIVYQLQEIANTSTQNYWLVMNILTKIIKNHQKSSSEKNLDLIQTTINIVATRNINKDTENEQIDLSYCDLRGINLENANLENANLYQSNLSQVNLTNANLKGAILTAANLENAILTAANLENAILTAANLNHANLEFANLAKANLYLATLQGINLNKTILEKANLREAKFT